MNQEVHWKSQKIIALLKHYFLPQIEKRIRLLTKNGYKDMFRKVRLDDSDLGAVLQRGTLLARDLYERRILSRLSEQEKKEFWEEKGLLESDYRGLVSQHLSNFFSPGFLTPLQARSIFPFKNLY